MPEKYRAAAYQDEGYQDEKRGGEKYKRGQRASTSSYKRALTHLKRYIRSRITPKLAAKIGYRAHLRKGRFVGEIGERTARERTVGERMAYVGDRVDFSLTDGTIWFVGAVIIRVLLNALVISFPFLQMPLLLVLVGAISYSIYRIVLSQHYATATV